MPRCAVRECKNYYKKTIGKSISYFKFPRNKNLIQKWLDACNVETVNLKYVTVCSEHFSVHCYKPLDRVEVLLTPLSGIRTLVENAIPTQALTMPDSNRFENQTFSTDSTDSTEQLTGNLTEDLTQCSETRDEFNQETPRTLELEQLLKEKTEKCMELENEVLMLKERVKELEEKISKSNENLGKIFTPTQLMLIHSPVKKVHKWTPEDISSAISLRCLSAKAYRYMQDKMHIPLPARSTLVRWASKFSMQPGLLTDVMPIMKIRGESMSTCEKLTVLCFDEVYLSDQIEIDRRNQQNVGPHKTAQVGLARGLLSKWRQPVYYNFDQPLTPKIIKAVVDELYKNEYVVVAIVTDLGPTNSSLWSSLKVGVKETENCYIKHPSNSDLKIFIFADVPHLIKLARNHLFDDGFCFDGMVINKSCLQKLLLLNTKDTKIAFKISHSHLTVEGSERQNVKLATQIFSESNAKALEWCGMNHFMENEKWQETANVLRLFNKWFNVFNSKMKYGQHPGLNAYGMDVEQQDQILNDMTEFIRKLRVGKHKGIIQFQKGILRTNNALPSLFQHLQETYNIESETFKIEYIFTYRLNQDILEQMFSYLRLMCGANSHPSALNFRYRLRNYVMGKHSNDIFCTGNTEGNCDETSFLATPIDLPEVSEKLIKQGLAFCEVESTELDDVILDIVTNTGEDTGNVMNL